MPQLEALAQDIDVGPQPAHLQRHTYCGGVLDALVLILDHSGQDQVPSSGTDGVCRDGNKVLQGQRQVESVILGRWPGVAQPIQIDTDPGSRLSRSCEPTASATDVLSTPTVPLIRRA